LEKYAKGLREAVKVEVGEGSSKKVVYMADLGQIKQLAEEEEAAFERDKTAGLASTLRERLNEYAHRYGLGDLLNVEEDTARGLAEAKAPELSKFSGVNFGTKASRL
jgi:hypothetical protein